MTDVPGHTRGLIAPLVKQGVGFLEIGVNGGSTVAKLPPLFLWKSPSGASLPVMYHWDYSGIAHVPGSNIALVTRVRDDNSGPHTADEIRRMHSQLEAAISQCGDRRVQPDGHGQGDCSVSRQAAGGHRGDRRHVDLRSGQRPAEGGAVIAKWRGCREKWIAAGNFKNGDATDVALLRRLLLEVEHTWGTDTKTWLDFDNYKPADLGRMLETKNYKVVQFSWQEKRQDLLNAVATLPQPLRGEARNSRSRG